jgi:hypothetical protein
MEMDKKNTGREVVIKELEKRLLKKWEKEQRNQKPPLSEKSPYLKALDIRKLTK